MSFSEHACSYREALPILGPLLNSPQFLNRNKSGKIATPLYNYIHIVGLSSGVAVKRVSTVYCTVIYKCTKLMSKEMGGFPVPQVLSVSCSLNCMLVEGRQQSLVKTQARVGTVYYVTILL